MKKKIVLLVMSLCLLMLIGGCKKKDIADNLNTGVTITPTAGAVPTAGAAPVKEAYVASDYVTLGQYKGVAVTVAKTVVTDADVDAAIQTELQSNATSEAVTDRPVQNGDTVNIDYEGLKGGVAFDGGTAKGSDLEIGSGSFIPGFEEGLIGAKIGDKLALNITFPADYGNADLAGQPVVFNVTVNSISKAVIPELTEEYVTANTDYASIQAYKDAKRADLQKSSDQTFESDKFSNVMQAIIDGSTFSSLPQNLISYNEYSYRAYNEQMMTYYGTTIDEYIASIGMSQEEYSNIVKTVAENSSRAEVIKKAIADTEGMKITEADYQQLLPQYLTDYGVDSETTLLQYESKEQTMENMLMKKVEDFIVSQAVITETTATPTPAPTATP